MSFNQTISATPIPVYIQGNCDTSLSKDLTIAIIVIICIFIALIIVFIILACTGVFTYSSPPLATNLNQASLHPQAIENEKESKEINQNDIQKENGFKPFMLENELGIWTTNSQSIDLTKGFSNLSLSFQLKSGSIKGTQCLFNNVLGNKGQFTVYLEDGAIVLGINGNDSQLIKTQPCVKDDLFPHFCNIQFEKSEDQSLMVIKIFVNQILVLEKSFSGFRFSMDLYPFVLGGLRTDENKLKFPLFESTMIEYIQCKENDQDKFIFMMDTKYPKIFKSVKTNQQLTWKPMSL